MNEEIGCKDSKEKLKKILDKFNNTENKYDKNITIHQLFEEQVYKTPNNIAVICKEESLTYRELNEKSNQLARKLRKMGVQSNTIVALMVKRNINMIVGIMAILKAGGCYMPIDSSYPIARINYMLHDCNCKIMLTECGIEAETTFDGEKVYIDESKIYECNSSNLENINSSSDLIYVIYTSGSTGKPKGVMIEHKSVHNFINGMKRKISFSSEKSIVSLTTVSFDIFVLESLLPLTIGMRIIIADPLNFSKYLGSNNIDMLQTTPSTMSLLLNEKNNLKYLKNLTEIMVGGEACPTRLINELKECTNARIYNMYGPTETTVWSTIKDLTTSDVITIGSPIDNTQIYIIDESGEVLPTDEVGELCIAGDGLARGYLGMKELTIKKFISNPNNPEQLMYRTGDIAKILQNGEIEYIGRNDSLVKIRGFRVGTGEIEDYMRLNKSIKDCAVIAEKNDWNENYLVCYYVAENDITVSDIISFLRNEIPEYMIPGVYIKVNKIPLTPNGKIDRKSLPKPEKKRPNLETFYVSPQNDIENQISDIWIKVLNLDQVGINDNFFQLGGNSILLCQMHVEIEKVYPGKIEIVDIFANPTVAKLSELINFDETKRGVNIEIPSIHLPDMYFNNSGNYKEEVILKAELDRGTIMKFRKYADDKELDVFHVLLGTYTYMLSQISTSQNIETISVFESHKQSSKVSLNFDNILDLDKLYKSVYQQTHNSDLFELNTINQLNRLIKNDKFIIPLFYFNINKLENRNNFFGLTLVVKCSDSRCEFSMSFNEGKLNKVYMEKIFIRYLSLLKNIANKF